MSAPVSSECASPLSLLESKLRPSAVSHRLSLARDPFSMVSSGCLPLDSVNVPADSSERVLKLYGALVELNRQRRVSHEPTGALLLEADDFFDRALMLFLLRMALRAGHASTWGTVATYYANYFAATAFVRLNLSAVTHLPGGAAYDVVPSTVFTFQISQRGRLRHRDLWSRYYRLVMQMAWPSVAQAAILAPAVAALRFREQELRERVNYRPGEGLEEIHLSARRYAAHIQDVKRLDRTLPLVGLSDEAYNDRLATERLLHTGRLLRRLEKSRCDPDVEA